MTKTCLICRVEKPLDGFYRHRSTRDGYDTYCKLCTKENNRKRHARTMHDPKLRAARRAQMRVINTSWRANNPQKVRACEREYEARDPEKVRARWILRGAVKCGKTQKPETCSSCHRTTSAKNLHGHHADYGKPLDVEWLCRECHGDRTREERL